MYTGYGLIDKASSVIMGRMDISGIQSRLFQPSAKRVTERGELLKYFSLKTGWNIPRLAKKLQGLELRDLYYLRSNCDQESIRGVPWGKVFFGSLKAPSSPK